MKICYGAPLRLPSRRECGTAISQRITRITSTCQIWDLLVRLYLVINRRTATKGRTSASKKARSRPWTVGEAKRGRTRKQGREGWVRVPEPTERSGENRSVSDQPIRRAAGSNPVQMRQVRRPYLGRRAITTFDVLERPRRHPPLIGRFSVRG